MEQLDCNVLFRLFVGLILEDPGWSAKTLIKDCERLINAAIENTFFERVLVVAREADFLSNEYVTVDGTLTEAWAGPKSFKPEDSSGMDPEDSENPDVHFRGRKHSNNTQASTTDPDARPYGRLHGTESKPRFAGQVLLDNRHGSAPDSRLTTATSRREREAARQMVTRPVVHSENTLGSNKRFDARDIVAGLLSHGITPNIGRR